MNVWPQNIGYEGQQACQGCLIAAVMWHGLSTGWRCLQNVPLSMHGKSWNLRIVRQVIKPVIETTGCSNDRMEAKRQ